MYMNQLADAATKQSVVVACAEWESFTVEELDQTSSEHYPERICNKTCLAYV